MEAVKLGSMRCPMCCSMSDTTAKAVNVGTRADPFLNV